jgi:hypothetical protein
MKHHITPGETKVWCWYLAALHMAAGANSRTVYLPVSYQCTRRANSLTGCGTCYNCTKQLIMRALHTSSCPQADLDNWAHDRAEAVFQHVTGLDERLNHPNGLGDDYTEMNSEQFTRVMNWAAEMIPMSQLVSSSAYATAQAEAATAPHPYRPYEACDALGRARCQVPVMYTDVREVTQCALTAEHDGEHGTLPDRVEMEEEAFKRGVDTFNGLNPVDTFAPFLPCPERYDDFDVQGAFLAGYNDQMKLAVANSESHRAIPALQNGVQR